ncbi:hypothetical protein GCM10010307_65140 [Streptomyces vastus]|uniref:Uncharacterized protein n=2 Tax=Streptomyces vastus TaxID=285451 RepID=A0ABP6DV83_9ACTN
MRLSGSSQPPISSLTAALPRFPRMTGNHGCSKGYITLGIAPDAANTGAGGGEGGGGTPPGDAPSDAPSASASSAPSS